MAGATSPSTWSSSPWWPSGPRGCRPDGGSALAAAPALDRFTVDVLTSLLILVAAAQAWNLLAGFAGQFSLGTAAFFGAGAYGVGLVMIRLEVPATLAVLAAAVTSAVLASLLALPLLRLRGDYFAIGSLTAALALQALVTNLGWLGGSSGLDLPISAVPAGVDLLNIALVVAAVTTVVCVVVRFSPFGLRLAAVRENADAAIGLGISVTRRRFGALVIYGALTGLAGGVFALQQVHLEPGGTLGISWTIDVVLMTVIGGLGTILGPIVGAVLVDLLLNRQLGDEPVLGLVIEGLVLTAVVVVAPRGLWPTAAGFVRRAVTGLRPGGRAPRPPEEAGPTSAPPVPQGAAGS